jgi:cytochrome c556
LTELQNLLMTPIYAKDNDEWMKAAVTMREMGERVLKAVQSKDAKAVEEVAGEIDATCDVCHDKYPAAEVPASAEGAKPAEVPK